MTTDELTTRNLNSHVKDWQLVTQYLRWNTQTSVVLLNRIGLSVSL